MTLKRRKMLWRIMTDEEEKEEDCDVDVVDVVDVVDDDDVGVVEGGWERRGCC